MQRDRDTGQVKAAVDREGSKAVNLQARRYLGRQKLEGARKDSFPKNSARRMALPIPWFEIMASRTEIKDFYIKLPS